MRRGYSLILSSPPSTRARNQNNPPISLFVSDKSLTLQGESNLYDIMTTQNITQIIADYFKTQPIQKAWLFGSFSRGEEHPNSDVDLLVVYDDKARVSLLKHAAMICDLEKLLNRPVDLVQDGTLLPFAVKSANHDKKLIYERAN